MKEDFPTALRQNRKEEIALPKFKIELAIHPGIDVHQLDPVTDLFAALPHAFDVNEPYVVLCLHNLPAEHKLRVIEACLGRDGIA